MPRTLPLRNRRDFDRVMSTGGRARRGSLQVSVCAATAGTTRLGLAVRVRPSAAVVRNRVRRRLRAAFRHCSLPEPVEVVIQADETAATIDFQELVTALCDSIREASR